MSDSLKPSTRTDELRFIQFELANRHQLEMETDVIWLAILGDADGDDELADEMIETLSNDSRSLSAFAQMLNIELQRDPFSVFDSSERIDLSDMSGISQPTEQPPVVVLNDAGKWKYLSFCFGMLGFIAGILIGVGV